MMKNNDIRINGRYREGLVRYCLALLMALLATFAYFMSTAKPIVNLDVESSSTRDELSSGNEVTISLPSRIYSSIAASAWRRSDADLSLTLNSGSVPAHFTWSGPINSSDLVALKAGPNGGRVNLLVDGKVTQLDLYDPFGKTFYIKLISLAPWNTLFNVRLGMSSIGIFVAVLWASLLGLRLALRESTPAANTHGKLVDTAYLSRLDHLRFFAAAVVLLYHFFHNYISAGFRSANPLAAVISEGHSGVALFMVLSGFIFAHIGHGKEIHYRKFLAARIVRIFPLYLFAVTIAISTKRWDFKPSDIVLLALPIANFYSLAALPFFGQLWTIGVEFQFYAVFPFLNRFTNLRGPQYLAGLLLLLVIIKACYFNQYGDARDFGYWSILGRMDQFIIGMLAALCYKKHPGILRNRATFPVALGLALTALTGFNIIGGYAGTGGSALWIVWPAVEASLWAAVTLTYLLWQVRIPDSLDNLFAKAGAISFSMYVMQYVALPQMQRYIGVVPFTDNWSLNVLLSGACLGLPAVLLLSCLTYALIERPFFSFKFRYALPIDGIDKTRPSSVVPVGIRKEA